MHCSVALRKIYCVQLGFFLTIYIHHKSEATLSSMRTANIQMTVNTGFPLTLSSLIKDNRITHIYSHSGKYISIQQQMNKNRQPLDNAVEQ